MYSIEDKAFAIREVQRYLLIISQNEDNFPTVVVDGIYGENTAFSVAEYKKRRNLPITAGVEKRTFDMLYSEASALTALKDAKQFTGDITGFPLKIGDSNNNVLILNALYRTLGKKYRDLPQKNLYGSFYSADTYGFTKGLQKIFGFSSDGIVTRELYARILEELNSDVMI